MTDQVSRRDMLKGTAVATAAAAALPAAAQPAGTPQPTADPQTKYRTEPYLEQRQPWPALQSRMNPVPDCGEASYRGSGRLAGRKALVTGGDSGIGRAAATAFPREGADVAINYYPTEEPDAQDVARLVRAAGRKCVLIPGDLTHQDFCTGLAERAHRELGGLDILVNNAASVNSFSPGKEILDYAVTKAGIAIFTKGWRSSSPSRASASTRSPPARSGRRFRSPAARRRDGQVRAGHPARPRRATGRARAALRRARERRVQLHRRQRVRGERRHGHQLSRPILRLVWLFAGGAPISVWLTSRATDIGPLRLPCPILPRSRIAPPVVCIREPGTARRAEVIDMAKGQVKGNKEARKPKKEAPPKVSAAAPSMKGKVAS